MHSWIKKTAINASLALRTGVCLLLASHASVAANQDCDSDSRLAGRLYGALSLELDWAGGELLCDSMGRPNGEGIRLRFSGPAGDSADRLTIIIALPQLRAGESKSEVAANLTIIEDSAGRFYGSSGSNSCWADIEQEPQAGDPAPAAYIATGRVYCINPLAQVNGNSSVRLDELKFSAAADWRPDE